MGTDTFSITAWRAPGIHAARQQFGGELRLDLQVLLIAGLLNILTFWNGLSTAVRKDYFLLQYAYFSYAYSKIYNL